MNKLSAFFSAIFGKFSWKHPSWMNGLYRRPWLFGLSVIGLALVVLGGSYGYAWYQQLPKPELVLTQITIPTIQHTPTPPAQLEPQPLLIDFTMPKDPLLIKLGTDDFTPKSVAPINPSGNQGGNLNQKITLTPQISGQWKWASDSRLVFTPDSVWPAGQTYTVKFAKDLFASHVKLASLETKFTTHPLNIKIADLKFYLDPKNPVLRQVVATLEFNYPIEPRSLEDHTSLIFQALKKAKQDLKAQPTKFTITYDEYKRTAYLRSDTLTLQDVPRFIELAIGKGVRPALGENTTQDIKKSVLIPDMQSAFSIKEVSTQIIRSTDDRPEQILLIETSVGVSPGELQKGLNAYLLPPPPENTQWETPGQITEQILKTAEPLTLEPIPTDQDYPTLHSFRLKAPGQRVAFISMSKGIKSYGDFVLTQDYQAITKIPDYPNEISFLHKGALLALSSDKKLSVRARGLPGIKFEIARVLPDTINHLVTQTRGDFSDPKFEASWTFNASNISEITTEIQTLEQKDPSQLQYTALDLGKYLLEKQSAEKRVGLFLIKAEGWDPQTQRLRGSASATRFILITNMGLLVKDNQDGSRDVFVQSITNGTPLANVIVSVLGKNGLPIMNKVTDAEGHVSFPTLKDFTEDKEPAVYLATLGGDVSFIPYRRSDRLLNYSRFDIGGIRTEEDVSTLTAYLFSDRGIYRPGDTLHLGMILKKAYAQAQAAGLPLEAVITDPRGEAVLKQNMTSPDSGYWTMDYTTDPTSPTGIYNINLFIVKDKHTRNILGSTTVSVEEFLPDRMRMTARLSEPVTSGWIAPDKLKGQITLSNLFGMAAADRRVTAKILLLPQSLQFKQYPDYTFTDPFLDPKKPPKLVTENLPETKTNSQGEATFDLGLERFDKATYQLIFFAQGFEAGSGRGVASQATALVSSLPYLIGYKPDGDLEFIARGSQRSVKLIAIDPTLKPIAVPDLHAKVLEQRTVASLVKNPDGTYSYQSVLQEIPVSSKPITITKTGLDYPLPSEKAGNYILVITDKQGTALSKVKFSIAGSTQQTIQKNAELTVKLNKSEYAPGEEIEMQITAPYVGAGLITIERDKVYTWQWFKTDTSSSVQKIRIPADFEGNGYINVAFVRDFDSDEIFISPLSYRVVPFSVNRTASTVNIQIGTPETAQPGKSITFTYSTDKPSKIIVYAVDEGILQVAHYRMPDPLDYFFRKRALEVSTQQIVDQILPKYIQRRELSSIGGDAALRDLSKNLNPFKRKTDLPVVYWSGIVDADSTTRTLEYAVPDYFNGSLKVMAVAVAPNAVGSASKSTQVKADFVLNPNIPTFVAPGDEFEVSVSVAANTLTKDSSITLALNTTEGLEIIGDAKQSLTVPNNQEKTLQFKLRARETLGSASLTFAIKSANYSGQINSSLSIRPASPYVTTLETGYDTSKNKTLDIQRTLYPEYRQLEAAASLSPLILLSGFKNYLDNYPFACTEQLVSKAFATLLTTEQSAFNIPAETVQKTLASMAQTLRIRQLSSGGFAYWPGMGDTSTTPFISIYALHFLTLAKEQNLAVPNEIFQQGIKYLNDISTQTPDNLEKARVQAYAIYILTRNEIVTTNQLAHLQSWLEQNQPKTWKQDLTSAYLAATWQLLKKQDEANRLITGYVMKQNPDKNYLFYNMPEINDAQYIAILADHFPEQLKKLGATVIMPFIQTLTKRSPNTLSAAYSALALSRYTKTLSPAESSNLKIYEILNNKKKSLLEPSDPTYQRVAFSPQAKQILFENGADKPYFYQITQTGFDKNPATKELKAGLEIYREYRDTSGSVVTEASLGTELEVKIKTRALGKQSIYNVAIVDLLPGGFEVVRDSIKRDEFEYVDIREDRVIFFTSINPEVKTLTYKIKAVNKGSYVIPPILANAMYNPDLKAQGVTGKFLVK